MGCDWSRGLGPVAKKSYFNPRTLMGCDSPSLHILFRPPKFQSTHPHGVRLCHVTYDFFLIGYFNPRTRMGCDAVWVRPELVCTVFQSTHPHGVRQKRCILDGELMIISIHAPAWGATHLRRMPVCGENYFNPRTRMGCDGCHYIHA